tara:strand:- start:471 stop:608 length:138 start_codon:yes stop_codon:yes gene_type:complete
MKNIIIIVFLSFGLISCASIKDKMPKLKECDGSKDTLADVLCKKK